MHVVKVSLSLLSAAGHQPKALHMGSERAPCKAQSSDEQIPSRFRRLGRDIEDVLEEETRLRRETRQICCWLAAFVVVIIIGDSIRTLPPLLIMHHPEKLKVSITGMDIPLVSVDVAKSRLGMGGTVYVEYQNPERRYKVKIEEAYVRIRYRSKMLAESLVSPVKVNRDDYLHVNFGFLFLEEASGVEVKGKKVENPEILELMKREIKDEEGFKVSVTMDVFAHYKYKWWSKDVAYNMYCNNLTLSVTPFKHNEELDGSQRYVAASVDDDEPHCSTNEK